jgi:uncharacterized membrane protein YfcA
MEGMNPRRAVALLVVGVVGGILSGLFGVGGGIIMVPLLVTLAGMDQRRASAASLAAIVPTTVVGTITYGAAGHIDLVAGVAIAAGGIVGSLIGARLLRALPLGWLRWLFIALLVLVAIRLFFEAPSRGSDIGLSGYTLLGLVGLGMVMGVASGLFGIGGGVIVVPALVAIFGASDLLAKGTSLLAIIPASVTGSIANLRAHLVTLADGLLVGVPATVASYAGAALAFLLPAQVSTILFAVLILGAVAQMTYRAIRHRPAPPAGAEGIAAPAED